RIAEIKLGANIRRAQSRDHVLIIGKAIFIEDGDDDRAGLRFVVELAEMHQRGGKPRYADGNPRGGDRRAPTRGDKPVISSAAADGAEAYGFVVVPDNRHD